MLSRVGTVALPPVCIGVVLPRVGAVLSRVGGPMEGAGGEELEVELELELEVEPELDFMGAEVLVEFGNT